MNFIELLMEKNIFVGGIVCDNHASNISPFSKMLCEYGQDSESFYLLKKVREKFIQSMIWYILSTILGITCWMRKDLFFHHLILVYFVMIFMSHIVYDKYEESGVNLKKALKITKPLSTLENLRNMSALH